MRVKRIRAGYYLITTEDKTFYLIRDEDCKETRWTVGTGKFGDVDYFQDKVSTKAEGIQYIVDAVGAA